MKKATIIITLILISLQTVTAQSIIPKFIRKMYFETDTSKRPSFVLIPVLSTAPETGIEIGGGGLYSFYTDTLSRDTRVSNYYGYVSLTTKGQSRLQLSTSRWTPQNKYHYTIALNYIDFPNNFYGIGNNTRKANAELLHEKRYRLDVGAEQQIARNLYAGFIAGAHYYKYGNTSPGGIFDTDPGIEDRDGGPLVFFGPTVIYDSRDNVTYTTSGTRFSAQLRGIKGAFSNNGYTGGLVQVDATKFIKLSNKFILGVNAQGKSMLGGASPFYLLPQMGSDELMRGYYTGRFRDRNLIAAQAELRYRITNRFGLAGFAGAGQVFKDNFNMAAFKPNYGGGFRYFFDVEKGLALRVDYGMGARPAGEERLAGLYMSLGQSF